MENKRKAKKTARRKTAPLASAKPNKTASLSKAKTAAKTKTKAAPSTKGKAASRASVSAVRQTAPRRVPHTMSGIVHPSTETVSDPSFRDAPEGWTPAHARATAAAAGYSLTEDHWEVIRVLQGCYKDEALPRIRLLHDALDARFAGKGGMKFLYMILPGGPITQGCALAGLKPPAGAKDVSFGSVA